MSYKILKLKSGEELISHVTEKNKRTMVLTRPMVFRTTTLMDNIGRPYDMTLLKDWLIHTTSQQIEIPKTHIASMLDPTDTTFKLYDMEMKRLDVLPEDRKQLTEEEANTLLKKLNKNKKTITDEEILNQIFGDLFHEMEEMGSDAYNKLQSMEEPMNPHMPFPEEEEEIDFIKRPMIYISMMLPPEALMNLMNAGILDPKQLSKIAKKVKKDNKFTGDEKTHPNYGNRWTDWCPDPNSNDYTDPPKSP